MKMKKSCIWPTKNVISDSDLTKIKRQFLLNIGQLGDIEAVGMGNAPNY
jgi:hypothetical protein